MQNQNSIYALRGPRVMPLAIEDIHFWASHTAKKLEIKKSTLKHMDQFMEQLREVSGIIIDPVEDEEWFHVTKALCHDLTICMPNSLYVRICDGEPEAVFILFHELGHLFLGHQTALHYSDIAPTKFEDAEWQADEYSKALQIIIEINYIPKHFCLKF